MKNVTELYYAAKSIYESRRDRHRALEERIDELENELEILKADFSDSSNRLNEAEKTLIAAEEALRCEQDRALTEFRDATLSTRASSVLLRNGIKSLSEVRNMTRSQLMKMRGMGTKTMSEVMNALAQLGLSLRTADEEAQ